MKKNIIILVDGTNNNGGEGYNTNVYKLFNMLESRSMNQIVFYEPGVGTGSFQFLGVAFGLGFSKKLKKCYQFIFENYVAGDQIYLFGFSRGAAIVRSLASFIDLFGILPKARTSLITKAWRIYCIKDKNKRLITAQEFIAKHHTMWCSIKFLGVWDTVSALGIFNIKLINYVIDRIPRLKYTFHDFRLSNGVENAYQALAIDENSVPFSPLLWEFDKSDQRKIKQVWFCGIHSNVGGSFKNSQLSDITLEWMVDIGKKHGMLIYPRHKVKLQPQINGMMHDTCSKIIYRLLAKQDRSWDDEKNGKAIIHSSVLLRKFNADASSPYSPWILNGDYKYEVEP